MVTPLVMRRNHKNRTGPVFSTDLGTRVFHRPCRPRHPASRTLAPHYPLNPLWTLVAVMLVQSLYFSRPPPPGAIIPDARPTRYIWKSRWPSSLYLDDSLLRRGLFRDLKIRGRRRQRKHGLKSEFAFIQSSSQQFQLTYFVECRRTLLKLVVMLQQN